MKKHLIFPAREVSIFVFLFLIVTSGVFFSCRKQNLEKHDETTQSVTIKPQEILDLLNQCPNKPGASTLSSNEQRNIASVSAQKIPFTVRWDKAQQRVIKGKHVVRVPISEDAFMVLTKKKEDAPLRLYLFKVKNDNSKNTKKSSAKDFQGKISWISASDLKLRTQNFKNGLAEKIQVAAPILNSSAKGGATTKSVFGWLGDLFGRAFCFVVGGTYWDRNDSTNGSACLDWGSAYESSGGGGTEYSPATADNWAYDVYYAYDYGESDSEGNITEHDDNESTLWVPYGTVTADTNYQISKTDYISTVLNLNISQRSILDANLPQRDLIFNSIATTSSAVDKSTAVLHIDKLGLDIDYQNFVANHYSSRSTDLVWFKDENWLRNANNFNLALKNNSFGILGIPVDYDDLNPSHLGSIENDDEGSFIGYNESTDAFEVKSWATATPATVPPAQFQVTTEFLRQLARSHSWDQGVTAVEFNRDVGKAFEEAVLRSLFNNARLDPMYQAYSPARLVNSNQTAHMVRPDYVGPVVTTNPPAVYPNQTFFEVKAVNGTIYASSSKYQIPGMIDVLANNRVRGIKANPALFLITTENTKISQGIKNYAARRGVELWQAKVYIDSADGLLFVGPAYHLNGKFNLPIQFKSTKVHLDFAEYSDDGPDYEEVE